LNVFIEAPIDALNAIIAKNAGVRELVDNRWLHLFAMSDDGRVSKRYRKDYDWENVDGVTVSG